MIVRHTYIQNQVLNIYKALQHLTFPLNLNDVLKVIPNCRYMSYRKFAQINGCNVEDVIQICESRSGCTHYDIANDRYLVLCNTSTSDNSVRRQRWTFCHEIGHVVCGHHALSAYEKLSENGMCHPANPEYEIEADQFASIILAPFPLFKILGVKSADDAQEAFGISREAAERRWSEYLQWNRSHVKTAWENDILRVYKTKNQNTSKVIA